MLPIINTLSPYRMKEIKAILEEWLRLPAPNVPGVNEVIKHKVTGILYEFNLKTYSTS